MKIKNFLAVLLLSLFANTVKASDGRWVCANDEIYWCYYSGGYNCSDTVKHCNDYDSTTDSYTCENGDSVHYRTTTDGYCADHDPDLNGGNCEAISGTEEIGTDTCDHGCDTHTGKCEDDDEPECNGAQYYECSGSSLIKYDSCGNEKNRDDCGADSYGEWSFYCSGKELRKSRPFTQRQCHASSGSCGYSQTTDDQLVETCPGDCQGNACVTITPPCTTPITYSCVDGDIHYSDACNAIEGISQECPYGCAKDTSQCLYEGIGGEEETPSSIALTEEIIKYLQTSGGVATMKWYGSQISVKLTPPSDLSDPGTIGTRCNPRISGIVINNGTLLENRYLCVSFSSGDKESNESTPCEKEYGVKITGTEPHFHIELYAYTESDMQGRPILRGKNLKAGLHLTQINGCLYLWGNARKRGLKENYCKRIICRQVGGGDIRIINPLKTPFLDAKLSEELSKFLKDIKQKVPDLLSGLEISLATIIPSLASLAEANLVTIESTPPVAEATAFVAGILFLVDQASDYISVHYSTDSADGSSRVANTGASSYLAPEISNEQILADEPDAQNYLDTLIVANYIVIWVLSNGGENFEE